MTARRSGTAKPGTERQAALRAHDGRPHVAKPPGQARRRQPVGTTRPRDRAVGGHAAELVGDAGGPSHTATTASAGRVRGTGGVGEPGHGTTRALAVRRRGGARRGTGPDDVLDAGARRCRRAGVDPAAPRAQRCPPRTRPRPRLTPIARSGQGALEGGGLRRAPAWRRGRPRPVPRTPGRARDGRAPGWSWATGTGVPPTRAAPSTHRGGPRQGDERRAEDHRDHGDGDRLPSWRATRRCSRAPQHDAGRPENAGRHDDGDGHVPVPRAQEGDRHEDDERAHGGEPAQQPGARGPAPAALVPDQQPHRPHRRSPRRAGPRPRGCAPGRDRALLRAPTGAGTPRP